jgi:DNA polymerase bacteriophage-type
MKSLSIDIETFSSTDLLKSGVYKYVQANDFTILLFAYSFDNDPVDVVDLVSGEEIPEEVFEALTDPRVTKKAYNANFERTCITKHLNIILSPDQWECTMAKASMLGLPLSLDAASKALKLEQGKSASGKTLIRFFSIPCKPSKANGGRTRNLPEHDIEKWQQFKEYCRQDVSVEKEIGKRIAFFEISNNEKKLWQLDQKINDTGALLDPPFVKNAIRMDVTYRDKLTKEAVEITGLDNPNSVNQLKEWISVETDSDAKSLTKESVPVLLSQTDIEAVKRVLTIRGEMAKTSVKKYVAMTSVICSDNRARGLLQYYGANRTGRWAGRLIQVQNLPMNKLEDLDLARQLVLSGDLEMFEILFGNVPDTLSQLIRTSFIASPGHRLIVVDLSAIEARIIAWLAGEKWRLDVFKTHGKIYEASASQMFKVPIESVTKASPLRQKGKISELALGYGGGPNALITMGALKMGIPEEELPKLVAMWRNSNRAIVKYWKEVDEAAQRTIYPGEHMNLPHGIGFSRERNVMFIELPSGRKLSYLRPDLKTNRFGGSSLVYEGMDQTTKQWQRIETYGGKLVENIVQAIARDVLAEGMLRLDAAGYKIILHVHDEIVMEMPDGRGSLEEAVKLMAAPISWAKGLPLDADGFETIYYKK